MGFAQAGQYFQPTAARHVQVQQQNIAGGCAQNFPQLGVPACFAGHLNVRCFGKRVANATPQDGMVVAQDDMNH